MLCREIIAVCSEIHTKHVNALWEAQIFFVFQWELQNETADLWRVPASNDASRVSGIHRACQQDTGYVTALSTQWLK